MVSCRLRVSWIILCVDNSGGGGGGGVCFAKMRMGSPPCMPISAYVCANMHNADEIT